MSLMARKGELSLGHSDPHWYAIFFITGDEFELGKSLT